MTWRRLLRSRGLPAAGPLLLASLALAVGCGRDGRPDVVLVTLDTTRADRLGAYGDTDARTPGLDALAARGTLFERAYSPVPLTLPSHTTILTGLSPRSHGVRDNSRFVVPAALSTLPERLSARGYATAAFVSAFVLDSSLGLDQGFDLYDDEIRSATDPLNFTVPMRPAEETTDDALAWLATRDRGPFFLWVHYYDAHAPRRRHPPFASMDDGYAAEIAYMDIQLGRLLAGVEQAARGREVLTLVAADHGESLGEHGEPTHGVVAYDSTLHVPLIAAGPGFAPGTRSRVFASTEDVTPTVLEAVGLPEADESDGRPLQSLLSPSAAEAGAPVGAAESERVTGFECLGPAYGLGWAPLAGVRTARWKYTAEPAPPELYDIEADPAESRDLAAQEPEVAARLAARYATREAERARTAPARGPLDPATASKLAELGYLSAPQEFAPGQAPDPRRGVTVLEWVRRAEGVVREGRVADGIEALRLLSQEPSIRAVALRDLGVIYASAGRTSEAIATTQQLLVLTGGLEVRIHVAGLLVGDGHPEAALALLDEVPAPPDGSAALPSRYLARGRALLALGRLESAQAEVRALLDHEPENDGGLELESRVRAAQGDPEAEIARLGHLFADPPAGAGRMDQTRTWLAQLLRRAHRDDEAMALLEAVEPPTAIELRMLADLHEQQGDLAGAAELYAALLERVPTNDAVRRDLADVYDELGRGKDALPLYEELVALRPEDATLRVDRGTTLYRLGRREEAERDFRAGVSMDDGLPEAHFDLGLVALETGRDDLAEEQLSRAIALRPEFAKAHFHLARLYRKRGDPRAADEAESAARASGSMAKMAGPPPALPPERPDTAASAPPVTSR